MVIYSPSWRGGNWLEGRKKCGGLEEVRGRFGGELFVLSG